MHRYPDDKNGAYEHLFKATTVSYPTVTSYWRVVQLLYPLPSSAEAEAS